MRLDPRPGERWIVTRQGRSTIVLVVTVDRDLWNRDDPQTTIVAYLETHTGPSTQAPEDLERHEPKPCTITLAGWERRGYQPLARVEQGPRASS